MRPPPPAFSWDEKTGIVIWNLAIGEDDARAWLARRLGTPGGPLLTLGVRDLGGLQPGGSGSPDMAAFPGDAERVVVFAKGWEPPLLEFVDLLKALRDRCGTTTTFVVVPINTRLTDIDRADREIWARFLGRQEDPRLYVMQETANTAGPAPGGPP